MSLKKISFIGGGRISWLLLKALQNKNAMPQSVVVTDPDESVRQKIRTIAPETINCTNKNTEALDADVIFLAVHPPIMKDILPELNGKIPVTATVVSLVPVVKMAKLSEALGCERIVRMIPNAPSLLGEGYNPAVFSAAISESDKKELHALFAHWGATHEVDEDKLEAYAIIAAMGPTYFWPQWIKLQNLGLKFGLSQQELANMMPAMLIGAVETLYNSNLSPEEVMDLIPVYPLKEEQDTICGFFENKLTPLYQKLSSN